MMLSTLGLKRNCARLFDNQGKVFLIALDHPQYMGCVQGLENTLDVIKNFKNLPIDGFVLSIGIAQHLDLNIIGTKKLVLRIDVGGSKFSQNQLGHLTFLPWTAAISLGADAVIAMLPLGENDEKLIGTVALAVCRFHSVSVPVILEVLPNPRLGHPIIDQIITGARLAVELGADAVKVPYTEAFDKVVSCCPVPILMAGGQRDANILDIVCKALNAGAKGLVFGRNVFQAEDPVKVIFELEASLRP